MQTLATLLGGLFPLSFLILQIPGNVMAGVMILEGWTTAIETFSFCGMRLRSSGNVSGE